MTSFQLYKRLFEGEKQSNLNSSVQKKACRKQFQAESNHTFAEESFPSVRGCLSDSANQPVYCSNPFSCKHQQLKPPPYNPKHPLSMSP